jgi:hypothetical protein
MISRLLVYTSRMVPRIALRLSVSVDKSQEASLGSIATRSATSSKHRRRRSHWCRVQKSLRPPLRAPSQALSHLYLRHRIQIPNQRQLLASIRSYVCIAISLFDYGIAVDDRLNSLQSPWFPKLMDLSLFDAVRSHPKRSLLSALGSTSELRLHRLSDPFRFSSNRCLSFFYVHSVGHGG